MQKNAHLQGGVHSSRLFRSCVNNIFGFLKPCSHYKTRLRRVCSDYAIHSIRKSDRQEVRGHGTRAYYSRYFACSSPIFWLIWLWGDKKTRYSRWLFSSRPLFKLQNNYVQLKNYRLQKQMRGQHNFWWFPHQGHNFTVFADFCSLCIVAVLVCRLVQPKCAWSR